MAVRVFCDDPDQLLRDIKTAILNETIETWQVDKAGDFTHTPDQWKQLAWFRPTVAEDRIVFNILGNRSKKMSKIVYGVYHGRFIEMLLSHFDKHFKTASATALATSDDIV